MAEPTIFHNPKCSKSRQTLAILEDDGFKTLDIVRYLETPPDRATLERILDALDDPPAALVRKDPRFKELGLTASDYIERDAVIDLLVEHPELMERPVVMVGDKAVIGRPPERVHDLL